MEKERILITVRTYPNLSAPYIETVCTGGITDQHEWRRLVPVPLRYLEEGKQYRIFDIVEVDVKPGKDGRPETRTPHLPSLRIVGKLKDWSARCKWINPTIAASLEDLTGQGRTLGPVTVSEVIDITARRISPDWSPAQKEKLKQEDLFHKRRPLEKIPYSFHAIWKDGDGTEHKSLIMAWEMLETYRQYRLKISRPGSENALKVAR